MTNSSVLQLYDALQLGENEFRLLGIESISEVGSPLICHLFQIELPYKDTPYIAISYTWGSQPFDHVLYFGDTEAKVTKSCYDALSYCASMGDTLVWIDQVCIDQSNLDERSAQVLLMHQIYSDANLHLIWLDKFEGLTCGLAGVNDIQSVHNEPTSTPDASEVAVDLEQKQVAAEVRDTMIRIRKYAFKCWRDEHTTAAERASEAQSLVSRISLRVWDHILAIRSHPYWERRWIVQEIVHDDIDLLIALGYYDAIDSMTLHTCDVFLESLCIGRASEVRQILPPVVMDKLRASPQARYCLNQVLSLKSQYTTSLSTEILSLLAMCNMFKTTIQLDRIYALQSLSQDKSLPKPDYSQSMAEVLLRLGKHLVTHGHGGETIAQAGLAYRSHDVTVPTWCPTYEYTFISPLNGLRTPLEFAAAGSSIEQMNLSDNGKTLRAHGAYICQVQKLTPTLDLQSTKANVMWILSQFLNILPASGLHAAFPQTLSELLQNEDIHDGDRSEASRIELILRLLQFSPEQTDEEYIHKEIQKRLDVLVVEALGFSRLFDGRKFCLTTKGHIGIVHNQTEIGDLVTILDGVNVTMILRPSQDEDETYLVVGDSYFVGLGKGEAMEPGFDVEPRGFLLV